MYRRLTLCLLTIILQTAPVEAASTKIAVVAPLDGPLAILGQQIRVGAQFAAKASDVELIEIGEACGEQGDKGLASSIIAAGANAAVGFLCTEDLQAALPAMAEADIPVLTVSTRSGILMEDALKNGWPLFRLAPAPNMEAQKAVDIIATDWAAEPFALIDDGTIHARELVEAIRLKLEEKGMKPAFVDTFRPAQEQQIGLVRRLSKAGATRVFVGGDRGDMATMVRDAQAERLPLLFLGGESMMAADSQVPLPDGAQAIVLPADSATPESAALAKAMESDGDVAEGYVFPSHAAVKILAAADALASSARQPLVKVLAQETFQTVLGPIGFGADHELRNNPYILMEWKQGRFEPKQLQPESD